MNDEQRARFTSAPRSAVGDCGGAAAAGGDLHVGTSGVRARGLHGQLRRLPLARLGGRNEASPLAGPNFMNAWRGTTARDLLDYIATTMPPGGPKLGADAYLAVTAFILQANSISPTAQTIGPAPSAPGAPAPSAPSAPSAPACALAG